MGWGRGYHLRLLDRHLAGETLGPVAWESADEAKEHAQRISKARGDVVQQTWSTGNKDLADSADFTNSHFASERNRFISISGASATH